MWLRRGRRHQEGGKGFNLGGIERKTDRKFLCLKVVLEQLLIERGSFQGRARN